MDLKLERTTPPQAVNVDTLPLDHPNVLAIARIETTAHPQSKPSFSLTPIASLYDLINQDIGFILTLPNEFGRPEQVQVAYSRRNQTKPEELLRNFEPERLPEISSNPDTPESLSLLKRLFVKVAALSDFARFLDPANPLPPDFAPQCEDEMRRLSGVLAAIRQLRASL